MDGLEAPEGAPRPATSRLRAAPAPGPSNASIDRLISELHDRAVRVEPRLTHLLTAFSARTGSHLGDLGTIIKTPESLTRKVHSEARIMNISEANSVALINDALRYTVVLEPEVFVDGVNDIISSLREVGLQIDREGVRNFFVEGNRYKGLHAIVSMPAGDDGEPGLDVEVQFHTPESLEMKHVTHELYEVYRDLSRPLRVRRKAYSALVVASEIVEHPGRVEYVGQLKATQAPVS